MRAMAVTVAAIAVVAASVRGQPPAAGVWQGRIQPGDAFLQLVIEQRESDGAGAGWSVAVTLIQAGALGTEASGVAIDGGSIAFDLAAPVVQARFTGEIGEDGRLAGTFVQTRPESPAPVREVALERAFRPTDLPDPMAFTGSLAAGGQSIEMTLVIARTPAGGWVGHLDIPLQQLRAFPVLLQETDGTFTGDLPVPAPVTMQFALDDAHEKLTGTFSQYGLDLDMAFERDREYTYRDLPRPQLPVPPFPYRTRPEVAAHPDGHRLAGTLTLPDAGAFGPGPYPAAVLISGSGQQDRDETIFGHKPFLVIADHLTRNGIAVMRYDDRGVGGSEVDDLALVTGATSVDFATDTLAVFHHLQGLREIDDARIGLVGHSEGGMIAPMVCGLEPDVAFAVLLAGPGVRGDALLEKQLAFGWMLQGATETQVAALKPELRKVMAKVIAGAPTEELRTAVATLSRMEAAAEIRAPGLDEEVVIQAAMGLFDNAWMRFFLAYDPADALAAMTCPVLAANGTLDLQVWHEQNLDAIGRVLAEAGRDVTIRRYDGLNHLFQPATTGSGAEYALIEITFDEQVLEDMTAWIREKTSP